MSAGCFSPVGLALFETSRGLLDPACAAVLTTSIHATVTTLPAYLLAFGLTCILESPFYLLALKGLKGNRIAAIVVPNAATHPFVYFVFPFFMSQLHGNYGHTLAIGEVFAPIVEALLLIWTWKVPAKRAWIFSVAANLTSWWLGIYILA